MPVSVNLFAIGDPELKSAVQRAINASLAKIPGNWQISLVGSQSNDAWELKIRGPKLNKIFTLHGTDGQHDPEFLRQFLIDYLSLPASSEISEQSSSEVSIAVGNRRESKSDVKKSLRALAEIWAISPADPRAFDEFVRQKGIDQERRALTPEEQITFRAAFQKQLVLRANETKTLIYEILQGHGVLDFFTGLGDLSSALKEIAYVTSLRSRWDENRLFVFCVFSREAPIFIEACLSKIPKDAMVEVFRSYLRQPADALNLRNSEIRPWGDESNQIDFLLQITSLTVQDQHRAIEALPAQVKSALFTIADRLVRTIPNDGFGRFLRLRLSVFVCLAAPKAESTNYEKEILTAAGHPVVVEVLGLVGGTELIVAELRRTPIQQGVLQPAYAAAMVDFSRKHAPEILMGELEKLARWGQSKASILSVAAQAALVQLQKLSKRDFQKAFLRASRSDKQKELPLWLVRNPAFIESIKLEQLPRALWKTLVSSFLLKEPQIARRVMDAKFKTPDFFRYWQDATEILARVDSPQAESLFAELIISALKHGLPPQQHNAITKEPARSWIQRRFWELASRVDGDKRIALFKAIHEPMQQTELLTLLEHGLTIKFQGAAGELQHWILHVFIPLLLETGALDPRIVRTISDPSYKEDLAKHLSSAVVADWNFLKGVSEEWGLARNRMKMNISSRLAGGIETATLNSRADSILRNSAERLSTAVQNWVDADSPKLELALHFENAHDLAAKVQPDKALLDEFFRHQPNHPQALALFLGANPWSFEFLLHTRGSWPSPDLILEEIVKSYIVVANLRQRAKEQLNRVQEFALVDLAIALRKILSDAESELAGYFAIRDVLDEIGLKPVAPRLGAVLQQSHASSEQYRILREPGRPGRLRVFSCGIKVGDKIVDTATVTQSGAKDDRD